MTDATPGPVSKNKFNLIVDFRWVSVGLLVVIAVLIAVWQPWNSASSTDRTVSVTGTAKVKAEPDEFLFNLRYEFKNTDKTAALAALTAKNNELVAGLKKLGVADEDIKNNSDNYRSYGEDGISYSPEIVEDINVYSLNMSVTIATREMAQKIEDYLLTTSPSGQVTPSGRLSDEKRKELEDKARDEANKDARNKADKSAKSLGYKIGRVKSVEDGAGFDGPISLESDVMRLDAPKDNSLTIQPGQDEIYYSVTVVYFVK